MLDEEEVIAHHHLPLLLSLPIRVILIANQLPIIAVIAVPVVAIT